VQAGGWLLLAVPTSGSFPIWKEAALNAAVPCTALVLPEAQPLIATAEAQLELVYQQQLRFSRPNPGGLRFLQQIKAIGAQASRGPQLPAGQLRRLLRHWPGPEQAILWEVLLLIGQKR
jgi:malonyl-CoA O-methyltransferase